MNPPFQLLLQAVVRGGQREVAEEAEEDLQRRPEGEGEGEAAVAL